MANPIYSIEDFEERISELAIGTNDSKQLIDFVRSMEKRYKWQSKRCDVAANLLGHDLINECMIGEDDV